MSDSRILKSVARFATPIRSVLRSSSDEAVEYLSWATNYNDKGLQLDELKYFADGEVEEHHRYTYNNEGHVTLHEVSLPDDGIEESFITERNVHGWPISIIKMYGDDPGEKTIYEYNENGQPLKIVQFDADGELDSSEEISYDTHGNMYERIIEAPNADRTYRKVLFKYNEKNLLVIAEEFDADGKSVGRHEYAYNEDGLEVKLLQFNDEGKKTAEVNSEYNEIGKITKKVSRGFYTRISNFEYDELGRIIEESLSDENGFVISRSNFEYNESGELVGEIVYETDLTRAGRDTHLSYRYEYSYFN
jgi:hypothetical protein